MIIILGHSTFIAQAEHLASAMMVVQSQAESIESETKTLTLECERLQKDMDLIVKMVDEEEESKEEAKQSPNLGMTHYPSTKNTIINKPRCRGDP